MRELLNTLYVLTPGTSLRLDHDALVARIDEQEPMRLPLLRIGAIVAIGRVSLSSSLIHRCAQDGRNVVWLDGRGRFRGRLNGPMSGNVLLRRAQHLALSDPGLTSRLARQFVAAKIQNSRQILLRGARETSDETGRKRLSEGSTYLALALERLKAAEDLDEIRGYEGDAARSYYHAFGTLIRVGDEALVLRNRSRRPPRDRANALLSFLYTLLRTECASALETVGLDPQVGFLHALRPGRPALALDLMEELRAVVADRLAATLINRRQLQQHHFEEFPGGSVMLNEDGRRSLLDAYQKRKATEVTHRVLREKVPVGLLPQVQARLLARHLRGDLEYYPPFLYR